MSNHIKIDEDYVKSLLENAAWGHDVQLQEEVQEEVIVEEHVCPLCESKLDEELSDEIVLEHLEKIEELLEANTAGPDVEPSDASDRAKELAKQGQAEAEKKKKVNAMKEEDDDEDEDVEEDKWSGQKKGDKPKGKAEKDDDKGDFETGARKGDKSSTHAGKDFEGDDDDDNGDPRAYGGKKGDKSKTHKGKDFEGKLAKKVKSLKKK